MDSKKAEALLSLCMMLWGVIADDAPFIDVFRDDFDGHGAPDRTKWNVADRRSDLEGELQYYRKGNVNLYDGYMHITIAKDKFKGSSFTSGQVNTRGLFDFQYGTIEWRAKAPDPRGIWPDVRLHNYQCDPAASCPGEQTSLVEVSPWAKSPLRLPRPGTHYQITNGFTRPDIIQDFHVYRIIWTSEKCIWMIDDQTVFNVTGKDVPAKRVQLVISVTVGRGIVPSPGAKFPTEFLIDYLVVRQKANITGLDRSPSTSSFVIIPLLGVFGAILLVFVVIAVTYFCRRWRTHNAREQTILSAAGSAVRMSDVHGSETFGEDCEYQYKANDMIGRGTFGIVYTATVIYHCIPPRQETGALKVVHLDGESHFLTDIESRIKWRNRMQTLILLRHNHLIGYHKITIVGVPGGTNIELLMDYCELGDLAHLLRKLREEERLLTETTAVRYASDITQGLEFLHRKTMLHGDLKPGNILAKRIENGEHRLIIGDLDDLIQLANNTTCTQDIRHLRGTVRYMSPEMLMKFAQVSTENPGRKTDIWSLGCIILDLIAHMSGRYEVWLRKMDTLLPAGAMIDSQFMMHIIDGFTPFIPQHTPGWLVGCVEQCFCIAQERRICAAQLLAELSVQLPPPAE